MSIIPSSDVFFPVQTGLLIFASVVTTPVTTPFYLFSAAISALRALAWACSSEKDREKDRVENPENAGNKRDFFFYAICAIPLYGLFFRVTTSFDRYSYFHKIDYGYNAGEVIDKNGNPQPYRYWVRNASEYHNKNVVQFLPFDLSDGEPIIKQIKRPDALVALQVGSRF